MSLKAEFDYFLRHQADLVRRHDGKCVVIKDLHIIGVYDDALTAVVETEKQHEPGSFLVQRVSPGEDAYTAVFHSRVALS